MKELKELKWILVTSALLVAQWLRRWCTSLVAQVWTHPSQWPVWLMSALQKCTTLRTTEMYYTPLSCCIHPGHIVVLSRIIISFYQVVSRDSALISNLIFKLLWFMIKKQYECQSSAQTCNVLFRSHLCIRSFFLTDFFILITILKTPFLLLFNTSCLHNHLLCQLPAR